MGVREPQQDRGHARRASVLEGAARVFDDVGFGQSTLKQITEASGATIGSVYFYFPAKDDMALAIVDEQNSRTFAAMSAAAEGFHGIEAVIRASRAVADALLTDVIVRAGIRLSLEQGTLATPTGQFYRAWIEALAGPVREAADSGELRTGLEPAALARAMVSWFTGVQLVSSVLSGRADLYQALGETLDVVLTGLAAPEHLERLQAVARELFARRQPGGTGHRAASR
ncbi:MAG TPA: ScbR family autoregulator-binding transcription factor [Friedmanniella sp.]